MTEETKEPEELSKEELAERRKEITDYYKENIKHLKIQLEYEELLMSIEKTRAERIQAQMFLAQATMNGGGSMDTETGLDTGAHSITVTDACGASLVDIVNISEPAVIATSMSQTDVSCFGGADGSATISVSGGSSPYNYLWNDPTGQTNDMATGLGAGTYSVVVTDNNGCTDSAAATISSISASGLPYEMFALTVSSNRATS